MLREMLPVIIAMIAGLVLALLLNLASPLRAEGFRFVRADLRAIALSGQVAK